jgi:hypothetical protein
VGRSVIRGPATAHGWPDPGYPSGMTTTPYEPQADPDVVPSGDPVAPDGPSPDPGTDPDLPPPTEPETAPLTR